MKTLAWGVTIVAVLSLASPGVAAAATPIDGGDVGGTVTPVNLGPGEQNDPHVSGDLVSYTDGSPTTRQTVRYYRFSTGADTAIPSELLARDLLSDVSGNRIAFTRISAARNAIFVFDTTTSLLTEIDPAPGSNRIGAAIGGDTVAFVEFDGTATAAVIFAHDLSSGATVQLSSGPGIAQNPAVAPSGSVVVWEQCNNDLIRCDVMKAVRSGATWSAAALVATSSANPDTDGTWIVYDSNRAGSLTGQDIYFQAVAGGPETQLQVAGYQVNPSISQGVIAFESLATGSTSADVFIYVVATNTMFRVTNTPAFDEQLNDISVLPNGDIRVVWAVNDGVAGDYNVYARTFTIAVETPAEMIADLIDKTLRFLDRMPLASSLRARLEQVASALIANNHAVACRLLNFYIAAVNAAPSGGLLTAAEKAELVADARAIKAAIGCP